MKYNRIIYILAIMTFLILLVGATFAYFAFGAQSTNGAVSTGSNEISINLSITPLYTGIDLIPTNDSDIMTAYNNHCVDIYNNGACQTYNIDVENTGADLDYQGSITFTLNHITNLNYMILDENDNVYQAKTGIVSGTSQSLGNTFNLSSGDSKNFKLIIWVPNLSYSQTDEDAEGTFSAVVTYASSTGNSVTGYISS